ncbi:hypothetical protein MLD38_021959 [Melastoma candidum]|uniref:Uncharacterized protein n=1 Tax=Melastoma candidum TaxID=119954 RepID=A0ACB9QGY0_9MYRT|nr:hypothetical protein MLD38_021959 [Melastoma candidum]
MSPGPDSYQSLPPLKRFTLLHHHPDKENVAPSFPLPAKKRRESRPPLLETRPFSSSDVAAATYPLPTKKRVWAPSPDFLPLLDLNSEYKPCVGEEVGVGVTVPELNGEEEKQLEGVPDCESQDGVIEEDVSPLGATKREVPEEAEKNPEDRGGEEDDDDDGILCVICQSTDGEPSDPIVFCDGCNLMAHATCYGNPLIRGIPDGEWYCHRCLASTGDGPAITCCLCPKAGGAMKPTVDGQWAHVVCAVFVPEVFFEDAEGREGINCGGVERGKRSCYVCEGKGGCMVECSESRCKRGFHVTCGLEDDLWLDYKEGRGKGIVVGFCRDHTELWKKQQLTGKFKIVAREEKL